MIQITKKMLVYAILVNCAISLSGCLAAELGLEGGIASIGEYTIIGEEIEALGGLQGIGIEFDASANLIRITEEEKFISALQKVKLEERVTARETPRLYFQENGAKQYFGEVVQDDFSGKKVINITGKSGQAKTIVIPKNWNLYRVTGDNINIKMMDQYGNTSFYKLYKLRANSVVFVVRKIGQLYEIQLTKDLTGFVDAALIAPILTFKHVSANSVTPAINNSQPIQSSPPKPIIDYSRGDYCIKNVSEFTMNVKLIDKDRGNGNWITIIQINPNEIGCFFDMPAKSYKIECWSNDVVNVLGKYIHGVSKDIRIEGGIKNPSPDNINLILQ